MATKSSNKINTARRRLEAIEKALSDQEVWISQITERMAKDLKRIETARDRIAELENERDEIRVNLNPSGTVG